MLLTFPLARIATVPVPLKFTQARAEYDGAEPDAVDNAAGAGIPVQLAKLPEVGVPNNGVTRVGEVPSTLAPVPVEVVTPLPPLATGSVPVTVVTGTPVVPSKINAILFSL
jgi:hypothetical protein